MLKLVLPQVMIYGKILIQISSLRSLRLENESGNNILTATALSGKHDALSITANGNFFLCLH